MATRYVRPKATMSAYFDSIDAFVVLKRDAAWRVTDPIVQERPDLFDFDELDDEHEVEQATAAPGERRPTRRKSS